MFVTLRKYRKLYRAYEVSHTALITARTERDEARYTLSDERARFDAQRKEFYAALADAEQRALDAAVLSAQAVRVVAEQAADAAAAKVVDLIPKPAPVAEPQVGESPTTQKLALSPALNAICDNYGFGDPKQTAANRRFALRLLALGKAEGEITQRIVGGLFYTPEEVTA
jgi:hypothetical protein